MFLSRIAINRQLRKSRQALAFPQMMHAAVLGSFPPIFEDENERERARVLWRIDTESMRTWLYVLSEIKPDFQHIVEQFGWRDSEQSCKTKEYDSFLNRLQVGQRWHFRLHANPVRTVAGKRVPLTLVQQKLWMREQAKRCGFSLAYSDIGVEEHDTFEVAYRSTIGFKKLPGDKEQVTLSVATFEGLLIVEDADKLRLALRAGIGKAKAYGCGLLTLANEK